MLIWDQSEVKTYSVTMNSKDACNLSNSILCEIVKLRFPHPSSHALTDGFVMEYKYLFKFYQAGLSTQSLQLTTKMTNVWPSSYEVNSMRTLSFSGCNSSPASFSSLRYTSRRERQKPRDGPISWPKYLSCHIWEMESKKRESITQK